MFRSTAVSFSSGEDFADTDVQAMIALLCTA